MSEINVVPYIDVMLVLLIVFMVTAPLLYQGIKVDLPDAKATPMDQQQEPVVIFIDRDGKYYLNLGEETDSPVELDHLQTQLNKIRRAKPNVPILIEGDEQVPYGKVVFLLSTLQASEIKKVGLVTEPGEANPQ